MTERMASICVAESTRFKLPTWNYRGTPVGVDVRRVVELDTTPKVTTGILHASSGVGQIGAGVATAPIECFRAALRSLASDDIERMRRPSMTDRTVRTRWTGGMRAVTDVDGFEIVVDEPETHGGTGTGPQPTDLLLASVASCIVLSMAFVARRAWRRAARSRRERRRHATTGSSSSASPSSISSGTPREVLEGLVPEAERVCYVSNTLRHKPELVLRVD